MSRCWSIVRFAAYGRGCRAQILRIVSIVPCSCKQFIAVATHIYGVIVIVHIECVAHGVAMNSRIPRLSIVHHTWIFIEQIEVGRSVYFIELLIVVLRSHGVVRTHINHLACLWQQSLNSTKVGSASEVAVVVVNVHL